MKITVTVDVDNIFVGNEGEDGGVYIGEAIKQELLYALRKESVDKINKESLTELSNLIKEETKDMIPTLITSKIVEVMANNKIRPKYGKSDDLITINSYIEEQININYSIGSKIDDLIKKHVVETAQKVAKELETRYDGLFAMQIVSNMKNMGMLKDDVSKMLLPEQP